MECRGRWPETPIFGSMNGEEGLGAGKMVVLPAFGTD